jgi:hypothetical protein
MFRRKKKHRRSSRVALFITYTMATPVVGGVFIRAIRLAVELARRGWHPVIANWGPFLDDPKAEAAKACIKFVSLDRYQPGLTRQTLEMQFKTFNPDLVIMGEGPFEAMELFNEAGKRLDCPFVVIDQFYNHDLMPHKEGVDLVLLYALASFWRDDLRIGPPFEIVPPFIEAVTPKSELPVPERLHVRQWITFVAYDEYVCRVGFELLAQLVEEEPIIIAISRNVELCREFALSRNIDLSRIVALPLQNDANVFGFFAQSAVTLVSSGFLQIMEALAMGSPVIALERGGGVGMTGFNIDQRFVPYVSFEQNSQQQLERIRGWLRQSPFTPELRASLACERHGTAFCANRIEAIYRHSLTEPRWRKAMRRWRRN